MAQDMAIIDPSAIGIAPTTPPVDTSIREEEVALEEEAVVEEALENVYSVIDPADVDNSPIILTLARFGVQYIVGQACDANLAHSTGNYTKIYSVEQKIEDSVLYYKMDIQIVTNDAIQLHAKFDVRFFTITNLQQVTSFSYEWQNPATVFLGKNNSYDSTLDQYSVTTFTGAVDWIDYGLDNIQRNTISYNIRDYLLAYIGYTTDIDISTIISDKKIQTSLNLGLQAIGAQAFNDGIWTGYSDIKAAKINSIYTLETSSILRYDVNFKNGSQEGRVIYIVKCPQDGVSLNCENAILRYYWFTALLGSKKTTYVAL